MKNRWDIGLFAAPSFCPFFVAGADWPLPRRRTIRIGSPFKSGPILVDAAEKFKDIVEKGSGGRIEVKIEAGVKAEEKNKMNSQGKLEMQSNGTNFLEIYAPQYFFFNAPYVMKDFEPLHARLERQARQGGAGPGGKER